MVGLTCENKIVKKMKKVIQTPQSFAMNQKSWLRPSEARSLIRAVLELPPDRLKARPTTFGVPTPRLTASAGTVDYIHWHKIEREPMIPQITSLMQKLCKMGYTNLNVVNINVYRSNSDSIIDHCDKDPLMIEKSPIVSVSAGAPRTLVIKGKKTYKFLMESGDLFTMEGAFQQEFTHGVPKSSSTKQPNSNLFSLGECVLLDGVSVPLNQIRVNVSFRCNKQQQVSDK